MAFPELTESERKELALKTFEHFGRAAVDFLRTVGRTDEQVIASVEDCGFENLEAASREGKGVLLITGHFGHWERHGHYSKARGFPLCVVARDADDPALQKEVARLREAAGLEVLSRGNAARAILGALKQNKIVGLLPDQNSAESFLSFFGKPAGTVLGPAVMHLRTGAPLLMAFCPRIGVGKYRGIVSEPLRYGDDPKPTPEIIMADINARFEEIIRQYPDQWLWLHDRWKSARLGGLHESK